MCMHTHSHATCTSMIKNQLKTRGTFEKGREEKAVRVD